jgi:hypothetical protein
MRSLWRVLALRWLGGHGSEGLAGSSMILEAVISGEQAQASPVFDVRREPGVSHRAMTLPEPGGRLAVEITSEELLRSGSPDGYHR